MSTKITPTVGRVVYFVPSARTGSSDFTPPAAGQPLAAIIAAVLEGGALNLAVFDALGHQHARLNVPLVQDGEDIPEDGYYAYWMPYQIGQAKKAEDREHDAKQLAIAADRASDDRRMRAGILDMALRTPGLVNHHEVLKAARAYQEHIEGQATPSTETKTYADGTKATGPAPLPDASPTDTSEAAIEREIQAKGLTAPRLSPADLNSNIVHTEFVKHVSLTGQVLRWAVLTTRNGFAVVGKPSVAVSPANDNAEIGEKVAVDNSRAELWPLMGYALKQALWEKDVSI